MASIGSNQIPSQFWQGVVEETWQDEIGKKEPACMSYLTEKTTKKKAVEYGELVGPQLWEPTQEAQDLVLDSFGTGIMTRVEPLKFSKRLIVPEEMIDDEEFGKIYDASRMLASTYKLTIGYDGVGILNDMFTGSNGHVGGDALSYANSAHPIKGGATISNLMSPVSPSNMAITTMLVTTDRLAGSNGLINGQYKLTKLIGPSAYRFRMKEILKSGQKDDTANNAINSLKGEISEYVPDPLMVSTTNWFGATDTPLGAIILFNRKARFRTEPNYTNETKAWMGSARWQCAVIDWRAFIGVNI